MLSGQHWRPCKRVPRPSYPDPHAGRPGARRRTWPRSAARCWRSGAWGAAGRAACSRRTGSCCSRAARWAPAPAPRRARRSRPSLRGVCGTDRAAGLLRARPRSAGGLDLVAELGLGLRVCRAPRMPDARRRSERARCAGRQYADRLPIGLERVIREVPASVVRDFYRRWYRRATLFALAPASSVPACCLLQGKQGYRAHTDAMPCAFIALPLTLRCGCKRWPSPVCEQRAAVPLQAREHGGQP